MPSFQKIIDKAKALKETILSQFEKQNNRMDSRDRYEIFESTYKSIVEYFDAVNSLREMPEYKEKKSDAEEAFGYSEVNSKVDIWLEGRGNNRRFNEDFSNVFRDLKLDFYPGDNTPDEEYFSKSNLTDVEGMNQAEERLTRIASKAEQMNSLMAKREEEVLDAVRKYIPNADRNVVYGYLHAEALYRNRKHSQFEEKLNNAKEYENTISSISNKNKELEKKEEELSENIVFFADKGTFEKEDAQKVADDYLSYRKEIDEVEVISRNLEEKTDRDVFFSKTSFDESFAPNKAVMCDYLGKYADSLDESSELKSAWNRQKELLYSGKDNTIMDEFEKFGIDENGLLFEDYPKVDKMLADLDAYKIEVQESIDRAKENGDVVLQTLLTASGEMKLLEITSKTNVIFGKYDDFKNEIRDKYTSLLEDAATSWDEFEKNHKEYTEAVNGGRGYKSFDEYNESLTEQEEKFRKCYGELGEFEKRYGFKEENRRNFSDGEIGDEEKCNNLSEEYRKNELNRITELNAFNENVATLDKELSKAKSEFGKENFVKIITLTKEAESRQEKLNPVYRKVSTWALRSAVGEYKDETFSANVSLLARDIRKTQEYVANYVKTNFASETMDSEITEAIQIVGKSLESYDENEYKKGKAKLAVLNEISERIDRIKESDEYKAVQNTVFAQAFDDFENMKNKVKEAVSKGESVVAIKDDFFENARKEEELRRKEEERRLQMEKAKEEEEARNIEAEEKPAEENSLSGSEEVEEEVEKAGQDDIVKEDAEKTNRILTEGISDRESVYYWRRNYDLNGFAERINNVKQAYLSFKQENPDDAKWDELFQNFDRRVKRMISDPINSYGRFDSFAQKVMDFNRYENNSEVRESYAEYHGLLNGKPSPDNLERLNTLNAEFTNYEKKYLDRYKDRNQDDVALNNIKNYLGLTEKEVTENLAFAGEISNSVSENQKKYDKYLDDCKKSLSNVPEYKKWSSDSKALQKQLNDYKSERKAYSEAKGKPGFSIEQDAKKLISISEKYQDISEKFAEYKKAGKGLYSKFFAEEKLILPQDNIAELGKSVLDKANDHFKKVLGADKAKDFIDNCAASNRSLNELFAESKRFSNNKDYYRLANALSDVNNSFAPLKESRDFRKLSSENKQIATVLLGLGNEKRYDAEIKNLRSVISKDIAEFSNDVILGWDDSLPKDDKLENAIALMTSYSKASKMHEAFVLTNPSDKELKAIAKYEASAQRLINEKMVPLVLENMENSMKKSYTTMNISEEERKNIADSIRKQINVLKNAGIPEEQYDLAEDFVNQYDAGERRKALAEEAKRLEEAKKAERELVDIEEDFENEKDDISHKDYEENLSESKERESDALSVQDGMREKSYDGKERISVKDLFEEGTFERAHSFNRKDKGKEISESREASLNSLRNK